MVELFWGVILQTSLVKIGTACEVHVVYFHFHSTGMEVSKLSNCMQTAVEAGFPRMSTELEASSPRIGYVSG